jgi:hypothetical protein
MSKSEKSTNKRLISVSSDVLEEVNIASVKEDSSTSKFIEDALKHAVRMNELGVSSNQLVDMCEVLNAHRVLGGVFVPMDVLDYLTNKAYAEDKAAFQAKWYDSGLWYGKFLKEKFPDPVLTLKSFLEATRWDLSEVDITRDNRSGFVKLRCISNVMSNEETELLVKFVEGVMYSLGYQVEKRDYMRGIAAVEFKK